MKIKIGEKVYLQKYDIARILHNIPAFPGSLVAELFENNDGPIFYNTDTKDALEFNYYFEERANVKWLMAQDWILDYDEYIKIPVAALKSIRRHREKTYKSDVINFNLQPREYRELYYDEIELRLYKEAHRIKSMILIVKVLTGKINLTLPSQDSDESKPSNIIPFRIPEGRGTIIFDTSGNELEEIVEESKESQNPLFSLLLRLYRRILGAL